MTIATKAFDENFAPVLRATGNARIPYLITVDTKSTHYTLTCMLETGFNLPVDRLLLTNDEDMLRICPTAKLVTADDEVIAELCNSNSTIAIFLGKASDAIMQIANERHEKFELDDKQWKFVKQYDNKYAYVRKLIDNPDFIAFNSKQLLNHKLGTLPKLEPWHTLIVSKSTHKCISILWDTREIVGFSELNDAEYELVTKCSNANDNCHMLYDRIGISDKAFNECIAYTLHD